MTQEKIQFLVDTDILVDHLINDDIKNTSHLEIAMTKGICFSTVINASEILFAASTENERAKIEELLRSLKILGLNSRYSLKISKFFNKVASTRDAIMCTVAEFNRLPILTLNVGRYKESGIKIISPLEL